MKNYVRRSLQGALPLLAGLIPNQAPAQNVSIWCYTGASGMNAYAPCALNAVATPSVSFVRPADTTAYTIGDLIANNTTVALVAPMTFTLAQASAGGGVFIRRGRLQVSAISVTAPQFRVHLYTTSPTVANGDNGAFSSTSVGWFCDIDINMYTTDPFTDSNAGIGTPNSGGECAVIPTTNLVYGLLEARGAYAPTSGETFSVTLEVY